MPLVTATLSDAEWKAWDQKYNVKGKSVMQLGREGQWLMDSLDPRRYQVLVHLVPAPVRLVIVKGFSRSYRNACALRWGPTCLSGRWRPALAGDPWTAATGPGRQEVDI